MNSSSLNPKTINFSIHRPAQVPNLDIDAKQSTALMVFMLFACDDWPSLISKQSFLFLIDIYFSSETLSIEARAK